MKRCVIQLAKRDTGENHSHMRVGYPSLTKQVDERITDDVAAIRWTNDDPIEQVFDLGTVKTVFASAARYVAQRDLVDELGHAPDDFNLLRQVR